MSGEKRVINGDGFMVDDPATRYLRSLLQGVADDTNMVRAGQLRLQGISFLLEHHERLNIVDNTDDTADIWLEGGAMEYRLDTQVGFLWLVGNFRTHPVMTDLADLNPDKDIDGSSTTVGLLISPKEAYDQRGVALMSADGSAGVLAQRGVYTEEREYKSPAVAPLTKDINFFEAVMRRIQQAYKPAEE